MTGFGEGKASNERIEVTAVLRSVNHRFLDLSIRMPDDLRVFEPDLAQRIRDGLARGRIELRVSVRPLGIRRVEVRVDEQAAAGYVEAARRLAASEGVAHGLSSADLLRLPEVISVDSVSDGIAADDKQVAMQAVERALEQLLSTRSREGSDLADVLRKTLAELGDLVSQLDRSRGDLQGALFEKARRRIGELTEEVGIDRDRLTQEIALLVDRADVQEEIDRLKVHVHRFRSLLEPAEPVGKQLDFLAQEILRELNTIGSKCRDSAAIQLVLDGKLRCEQLREQVQNVE